MTKKTTKARTPRRNTKPAPDLAIEMPLKQFFGTLANAVADRVVAMQSIDNSKPKPAALDYVGERMMPEAPVTSRETPFNVAAQAASAVSGLAERVMSLAGRLVGSEPSNGAGTDAREAMPSGELNQLEVVARNTIAAVCAAHDALNRIDRALP